ncbi:hypothetical protein [Roseateles sp.]|uniref:hypothetical protein n=1 Tax=Roseateles sp. TaxID=1971397 RepID=UPI0025DEDDCC|nr:hypothetical protein [Roseateles sp.]MBV8036562.1 hypothetical protein [Roseateles sp.]
MCADRYEPPLKAESLNALVRGELLPQLAGYFELLDAGGADTRFNGEPVFGQGDVFLPGKIAIGLAHLLTLTPRDAQPYAGYLAGSRRLMALISTQTIESWGIYYALMALNRLRKAGLLEAAVEPDCLRLLQAKLDWRHFVDEQTLRLKALPTNYYGVAFGIARLRMLLQWEDASASETLLAKTLDHYERYSGEFGFSDETEGEGRFDRYSILLAAEFCERFIETELPVTPRLKTLLAQSAQLALQCASAAGDGFGFGRSIGPYGDTGVVEILATAARLGVLDAEEARYAYAFCVRATAKYVDFWFDPALNSLNLWTGGRSTDGYRGPHRMLGENFSIIHQLLCTCELWAAAGLADQAPPEDLGDWLERRQPDFRLNWFARGHYERALVTRRDRGLVFTLPLINGGVGQHDNAPYYPIPFSPRLVEGRPESGAAHAQLLPRLALADGSVLLPTSFIQDIKAWRDGDEHVLSYSQPGLNRVGGREPHLDTRVTLTTEYRFGAGRISRIDTLHPAAPLDIASLSLDFACFSAGARPQGLGVSFDTGVIARFEAEGYERLDVQEPPAEDLQSLTSGPSRTHLHFSGPASQRAAPLQVRWTLSYR